jgi:D-aminopeptidase
MMRVFEFRDVGPNEAIEALVIALDQEAATAIFQMYLRAHDGDPDSLLWRQLQFDHLTDEAGIAVQEALDLGRQGLVVCDAHGQWVFVVPLGDLKLELDDEG